METAAKEYKFTNLNEPIPGDAGEVIYKIRGACAEDDDIIIFRRSRLPESRIPIRLQRKGGLLRYLLNALRDRYPRTYDGIRSFLTLD